VTQVIAMVVAGGCAGIDSHAKTWSTLATMEARPALERKAGTLACPIACRTGSHQADGAAGHRGSGTCWVPHRVGSQRRDNLS